MAVIDVVYKLGIGSKWQDNELRYSLRSLEQNFENLGNVFIVGNRPNWLQNVIFIPALDPYKANKDANLINKLILACYHKELSEEFLNMSDDMILLQKRSYDDFKVPYTSNSIANFVPNQKLNKWQTRIKATIDILKERHYRYDIFEAHCPYLIRKKDYPTVMLKYAYGEGIGYCGNTLYYNTMRITGKEKANQDVLKLQQENTYEKIKKECENKLFLNFNQGATNNDLKRFLSVMFPEPSTYECN